jgi:hypothetical protein
VIARDPWFARKSLIRHVGCREPWIECRSTPKQVRTGRRALGVDVPVAGPRGRAGVRREGTRNIEAMRSQRQGDAKP